MATAAALPISAQQTLKYARSHFDIVWLPVGFNQLHLFRAQLPVQVGLNITQQIATLSRILLQQPEQILPTDTGRGFPQG